MKTVLGWLLRGPTGPREAPILRINALVADSPSLKSLIRRLYDQDFQEVGDPERIQPSAEDIKALALVEQETQLVEGQYEVPIPRTTPPRPEADYNNSSDDYCETKS